MGDHTLLFNVGMTCGGCKGAVTRIVSKLDGVTSFDADVANQKLTIVGTVSKDVVMEKLGKWASAADKTLEFVSQS